MLQVKETHVPTPRFPVIDIHTHISFSAKSKNGVELAPERVYLATPEELLRGDGPEEHSLHGQPDRRIWRGAQGHSREI